MYSMLHQARNSFSELPRGARRAIIAILLFIDATLLGLLEGKGLLNLIDIIVGGGLPEDLVWLLQIVESIVAGFAIVKVLFDDVQPSPARTTAIFLSPLFLLVVVFITLDSVLQGLETKATVTLDLVSIGTNTLTWASTYLAIAIGLTLTYKVQRYGNFAQSEFFMIGMYLAIVMLWSDYFFPLYDAPRDGVMAWSILIWILTAAFILTGIAGIIIDRLVYKGFREKKATPQVMMIASLGIALILRAITYIRFGAGRNMFEPDADWRMPNLRWEFPTTKIRLNLGNRSLEDGQTYTQYTCEQTGVDAVTGEPILTRIVNEASRPAVEIYDVATDCITQATTNYAYYKGVVPAVVFISVALLFVVLTKTRLGRRMRAVADNPDLAASSGINVERVQLTSAFLSAGLSGLGGCIFAITLRYNPETAFTLLLPSFAVIVLGTIGSIPGAIVGSLIVGFVRALSSPILLGIGQPLQRSNYYALDGVMPYIFLVAILMIMPEGIGDAYEKWKIERLRKKKYNPESLEKTAVALAILPTGILGLHHWWRGRTDKAQSFSIVLIGAYVFHRISNFIGNNSFADGSCSEACKSSDTADTNLAVLTGRNDGTLGVEDSPFFVESVTDMDTSWFNLMEIEVQVVNFIVELGDIIWPLIPILIWAFAIIEGINILRDGAIFASFKSARDRIPSIDFKLTDSKLSDRIRPFLSDANKRHAQLIRKINSDLRATTDKIRTNFTSGATSRLENYSWWPRDRLSYGREGPIGSWLTFGILLLIMFIFMDWLPIADSDTMNWNKAFQVSNVLLTLSIFILMAFSLNLHTGITGMVNFGVIFFVGVGAITVGILTAPKDVHGYAWDVLPATIFAVLLAAAFGWSLAYPTARLRMDYFAIVTISLGEIVRVLLAGEPLLRVGAISSAIGISKFTLPLKQWWFCGSGVAIGDGTPYISADACRDDPSLLGPADSIGELLNLGEPAPYVMILAIMGIIAVLTVWWLLESVLASPWGRILKAIREDEEVAQHHGHDVLSHKAASLALGAAIAGLAGAFWAWKLTGFEPTFMSPARSTFLVWAAFIIGGAANNRGMIIGAFIIVLMEFVFNVLVAGQGSPDLPLYTTADHIDRLFEWLVTSQWNATKTFLILAITGIAIRSRILFETGLSGAFILAFTAIMMGQRSIDESFFGGNVIADMAYIKVLLIGCLMLFSLKFNAKGLLPEVPNRPSRSTGGDAE